MTERDALRRLRDDFLYYAPRMLKVLNKAGETVPLILNQAQQFIHARLEAQLAETGKVRALILKGRQQGASTLLQARFYWKLSNSFGKRAFVLTHEQAATDNMFAMAKRYHDNVPEGLRVTTGASNAKEMTFAKLDCKYSVATAGTKEIGRSSTVHLFHGSECAFWPNAASHFAGVGQSIPDLPGTEIVLESTGNGQSGEFYGRWNRAIAGVGDYIAIFVPWFWQTEYRRPVGRGWVRTPEEQDLATLYGLDDEQLAFRRNKIETDFKGDSAMFEQEYPNTPSEAFQAANKDAWIEVKDVQAARKAVTTASGPLVVGVDPARFGDDRTAIVWRRGRVVQRIRTLEKKTTMQVAGIVAQIIEQDRPARVFIDVVGLGVGIFDRLEELNYGKVLCGVGGAESASDDDHYRNKRAECWGRMKEWFGKRPVQIPDSDEIAADLLCPGYTYDSHNRLLIESKESIRKDPDRRSPDCFVAGTMISTPGGPVPIEAMRVGEKVCTPVGVRHVIKVWRTTTDSLTTAKFSNGAALTGKGSHDIFTYDNGWVRLDALALYNVIESDSHWSVVKWKFLRKFFTPESRFGFKRLVGTTSLAGRIRRRDFFIGASGLTTMGLFLTAITSITSMVIGRITALGIWKRFQGLSTNPCIYESVFPRPAAESAMTQPLSVLVMRLPNGMDLPLVLPGTPSMACAPGKTESRPLAGAQCAARTTSLSSRIARVFALSRASSAKAISGIKQLPGRACSAAKVLSSISFASKSVAPVSVGTVSVECGAEVFNLTLDSDNVYYANGILVANCADAIALTFAEPVRERENVQSAAVPFGVLDTEVGY